MTRTWTILATHSMTVWLLIWGPVMLTAQADSLPDEESQIHAIVRTAASICRGAPVALAKPDESSDRSEYTAAIEPVLEQGQAALPVLRELASSKDADRFEARLAAVLARRIEHPDQFARVAGYFIPDATDPMANLIAAPSRAALRRRQVVKLKPIDVELMDNSVREVVAKHPKVYQEVKTAAREMLEQAARNPQGGDKLYWQLKQEFGTRLLRIKEAHSINFIELSKLRQATGLRDGSLPPLDDRYLMAWEEAMVRPIPWQMKRHLLRIVLHFENDDSLPALGLVLGQAARSTATVSNGEVTTDESVMYAILDHLVARPPSESILRELSDVIQRTDGKTKELLQYLIGGRVSIREPWQDFLTTMEGDAKWKQDVDRIRTCVEKYKQRENAARAKIERKSK